MKIFVDLDGTLFKTSTTSHLLKSLKIRQKIYFYSMILVNKRSEAKAYLAKKSKLKNMIELLSTDMKNFINKEKNSKFKLLNSRVLQKLISAKNKNKNSTIVLATGANKIIGRIIINCINKHVKHSHETLFDESIGSNTTFNAVGENKAYLIKNYLKNKFMKNKTFHKAFVKNIENRKDQFHYFGNTWQDIPVWTKSKKSFIVSNNPLLISAIKILQKFKKINKIEIIQ
jgi:hypothetical protein